MVIVCIAFPAAASRDLSVLRHVTMISGSAVLHLFRVFVVLTEQGTRKHLSRVEKPRISLFSLAFMASLVVSGALGGPKPGEENVEVIMHGRAESTLYRTVSQCCCTT